MAENKIYEVYHFEKVDLYDRHHSIFLLYYSERAVFSKEILKWHKRESFIKLLGYKFRIWQLARKFEKRLLTGIHLSNVRKNMFHKRKEPEVLSEIFPPVALSWISSHGGKISNRFSGSFHLSCFFSGVR